MATVIPGEQPVVSPHDETWEEGGFFARTGVEEICVVDPRTRQIRWLALRGDAYEATGRSVLLRPTARDLVSRIDWPG